MLFIKWEWVNEPSFVESTVSFVVYYNVVSYLYKLL